MTLSAGAVFLALALGTGGAFLFRPQWIVSLLARTSPDVVYCWETAEAMVALTIDDGPDADTSPRILDLLRRHDAHATFFVLANHIAGHEEVISRTVKEGHELGNHLTTATPSIVLEASEFERQLLASHRVLAQFGEIHWFRPGSGWYNPSMLSILKEHGYRCALGSVYPFDPQTRSARFAAEYVLQHVRPGAVIVLHDRGARGERTAQALEVILPELGRRGLRVVTLSELAEVEATAQ